MVAWLSLRDSIADQCFINTVVAQGGAWHSMKQSRLPIVSIYGSGMEWRTICMLLIFTVYYVCEKLVHFKILIKNVCKLQLYVSRPCSPDMQ